MRLFQVGVLGKRALVGGDGLTVLFGLKLDTAQRYQCLKICLEQGCPVEVVPLSIDKLAGEVTLIEIDGFFE